MGRSVPRQEAEAFVGLLHSLLRALASGSNDPAAELPLAQLRVCHVLQAGAQSISIISRELHVSVSAVTQIADRLERAKLVHRVAEDGDRRVRRLQLTRQGENLLQLHDEDRIRRTGAMLEQLTPKVRKEAAAMMERLGLAAAAARGNRGDAEIGAPHFPKSKVLP